MKTFLIKWVLPIIMDLLIEGLRGMVKNSTNTVDDKVVKVIKENKAQITAEILKKL